MDATSSSKIGGAANQNPFFRSLNQSYGEPWQSSNGVNPLHLKETPDYKDLVRITIIIIVLIGRERCRSEKLIEDIQARGAQGDERKWRA